MSLETLQPLGTIEPAQVAVERTERRVPCLSSNLHHEAIGESDDGMLTELRHSSGDHLSFLDRQVLMAQQHFDCGRDSFWITTIDGREHPGRLGDRQCGTHAALATHDSAAATSFTSSRVTSRTSTLLSTARMALGDVSPDAVLHLLDSSPLPQSISSGSTERFETLVLRRI